MAEEENPAASVNEARGVYVAPATLVATPSTLPPASSLPLQMPPLPSLPILSSSTSSEACNEQDQSRLSTTAHNSLNSQENCFIKEEDEDQILDILRMEVPNSLESKGLADVTRRLQEIGLVPQEVKSNMDIMHCSVPHESRCRYLMVHVCQSIKYVSREDKIRRLLMLCKVLRRCVALSHIWKQINNIIAVTVKGNSVTSHKTLTESFLNPELHLGPLYDLLLGYAYKWEHLGIAFHFADNEIRTIESKSTDDVLRLRSVLNTWLSGTSRSATAPTLDNLRKAFLSEAVNMSRLVGKVEEILVANSVAGDMRDQNIETQLTSSNLDPIFVHVSSDIFIKETYEVTAILIEAITSHSESSTTPFYWYKDEELLLHEPFPILCVKIQDIKAEGSYYCSSPKSKSRTIQVHVETLLDNYRSLLINRYCLQPEVEPDSWPHVSQNTYINLAVVGNESSDVSDSYQETIRGDADDVFQSKSSVNYNEVLEKIVYGNRVIIVGRPGSGKTTLVHRISQDWAKGTLLGKVKSSFLISLRNFRGNPSIGLIELIMCCFDNVEDAKIVCDYIEKHQGLGVCFILDGLDEYQLPQTQTYYIDRLIKGQALPQAIVIVASRPAATDKYRINRINLTVEVLGFFKEQIKEYIESYHFKDKNKCSSLQKYLVDHVNVYRMCYLPIQTAMICFLYDISGDSLPDRESKIYYDFTVHTIKRSFCRNNHDVEIKTLDSLDRINKDIFLQICKLAFEKTVKLEQVIYEDENIEESLGLITVDRMATRHGKQKTYSFCHLTFQEFLAAYHISRQMDQEQLDIIKCNGPKKHLYMVFKFYCGLAQFKEKDIRFKTLIKVAKFNILHTFQCCYESQQPYTCNLVAHNNIVRINEDFTTPSDYTCLGYFVMNAQHNPVRIIECGDGFAKEECAKAFVKETRNSGMPPLPIEMWVTLDACDMSCEMMHMMHVFPSVLLVDADHPVVYGTDIIINRSFSKIELIAIQSISESDDLTSVVEELKYNFENIRSISLPKYHIKDYSSLLPTVSSIYCSPISSFANIDFHRAEILLMSYHLKCSLHCHHLIKRFFTHCNCLCSQLNLFNCNVNDERAALLAEGLERNYSVEVLQLVANDIGDEGAMAIASGIAGRSNLRYLDLSLNKIGDKGAKALVKSNRKMNRNLLLFGNLISSCLIAKLNRRNIAELFQTLKILCSIRHEGFHFFMNKLSLLLSSVTTLHTLHLQSLSIDDNDTEILIKMISKLSDLYSVSFEDMNIKINSMRLLSNSLVWRNVHILNLSHNFIGPEGTTHVCRALQGISHQILTLNLGHNNIGVEGALAVAECLQVSRSLCELDLSYNDIQDTGTEAICESLKNGDKLQVLNLATNSIRASGCLAIAILLERHGRSLITLDLSCNRLIDLGAICIARGLRYCSSLQKLHLKDNRTGDIGVEAVAEVLKSTDLMELILEDNFINNNGAKALACGLKSCCKLTQLRLSNNIIGDVGAGCLGEGLRHCSRLHRLELNQNSISGSGAVSLAEGVRYCHDLNTLELGDNSIIESDLKPLVMALKECKELESLYVPSKLLDLYENPFNEDICAFTEYLPKCSVYGTVDKKIVG